MEEMGHIVVGMLIGLAVGWYWGWNDAKSFFGK